MEIYDYIEKFIKVFGVFLGAFLGWFLTHLNNSGKIIFSTVFLRKYLKEPDGGGSYNTIEVTVDSKSCVLEFRLTAVNNSNYHKIYTDIELFINGYNYKTTKKITDITEVHIINKQQRTSELEYFNLPPKTIVNKVLSFDLTEKEIKKIFNEHVDFYFITNNPSKFLSFFKKKKQIKIFSISKEVFKSV